MQNIFAFWSVACHDTLLEFHFSSVYFSSFGNARGLFRDGAWWRGQSSSLWGRVGRRDLSTRGFSLQRTLSWRFMPLFEQACCSTDQHNKIPNLVHGHAIKMNGFLTTLDSRGWARTPRLHNNKALQSWRWLVFLLTSMMSLMRRSLVSTPLVHWAPPAKSLSIQHWDRRLVSGVHEHLIRQLARLLDPFETRPYHYVFLSLVSVSEGTVPLILFIANRLCTFIAWSF